MSTATAAEPFVSLEFTPNPNTLKYVVEVKFLDSGAANFVDSKSASVSPLASSLFKITGISAIMIGRNFVTITKAENFEWDQIHEPTDKTIKDFITSGAAALSDEWFAKNKSVVASTHGGDDSTIVLKIKKILDEEIRPAVAQDGGDIVFDKFENGIVYLFMQGSCAGCPSSTMTLKMGIETRLKEALPEIQEVVAI